GPRAHLRAAHERLDGRAQGARAGAGHRHVQPDAPAWRVARYRDHGDAAHSFHDANKAAAHRARDDDGSDVAGSAGADHAGVDGAWDEPGARASASTDGPGPADQRPGERARFLEDLRAERLRPSLFVAVALPFSYGEGTRRDGARALRWLPAARAARRRGGIASASSRAPLGGAVRAAARVASGRTSRACGRDVHRARSSSIAGRATTSMAHTC